VNDASRPAEADEDVEPSEAPAPSEPIEPTEATAPSEPIEPAPAEPAEPPAAPQAGPPAAAQAEPPAAAQAEPPAAAQAEPPAAVIEQVDRPGVDRTTDRRLARLHLRTGSRALARVELETLAGAGGLDDESLLDLAEIRWRTDDLTGAGEAAAAYLASGREAPLALVIVAEATAALGRPGEARRLANRALELIDGPLDGVFAGMPRSDVWPAQPVERAKVVGLGSGGPQPPADPVSGTAAAGGMAVASLASGSGSGTASPEVIGAVTAGVATRPDPGRPFSGDADAMPDPPSELAAARAALAAGDRSDAAIRLSVVLRLAPALAPAVLDIAAAEPGPDFDLVRGDALRLVGRESQARRSFAAASRRSASEARDPGTDPDPGADADPEADRPA
jgi:hypothetical protein